MQFPPLLNSIPASPTGLTGTALLALLTSNNLKISAPPPPSTLGGLAFFTSNNLKTLAPPPPPPPPSTTLRGLAVDALHRLDAACFPGLLPSLNHVASSANATCFVILIPPPAGPF